MAGMQSLRLMECHYWRDVIHQALKLDCLCKDCKKKLVKEREKLGSEITTIINTSQGTVI
jgi:hypothetical protein